jgi:putative ABC transport system permease protein
MSSVLAIAWQGVRSRLGRSTLTALSLLVGVLAIVVIQAGAGAARDAVLAQSLLTSGRAVTVALDVQPGRRNLDNALRLRRQIDAGLVPAGGSSAVLLESDISVGARSLPVSFFDGDLRAIRPFPLRAGGWPTSTKGLEIPLVLNVSAASAMNVPAGSAIVVHLGKIGQTLTGVVVGVVDDGQKDAHAFAPLASGQPWLRELAATEPAKVIASSQRADPKRLSTLVGTEYRRAFATEGAPPVVRLDQEDAMARQLQAIALVFSVIAALSLFVGALGILNIGLATLRERSDELSLRRSFGATRAQVVAIVVVEGQIIALTSAALALGVGVAVFPTVASLVSSGMQVSRESFPVVSAAIGAAAGCFSALLGSAAPALRAGRVPIASIMRA